MLYKTSIIRGTTLWVLREKDDVDEDDDDIFSWNLVQCTCFLTGTTFSILFYRYLLTPFYKGKQTAFSMFRLVLDGGRLSDLQNIFPHLWFSFVAWFTGAWSYFFLVTLYSFRRYSILLCYSVSALWMRSLFLSSFDIRYSIHLCLHATQIPIFKFSLSFQSLTSL